VAVTERLDTTLSHALVAYDAFSFRAQAHRNDRRSLSIPQICDPLRPDGKVHFNRQLISALVKNTASVK
jgi:hypothetical protein